MLFILDHNVDRAVGKVLRRRGHRCVAVGEMGLATATDADLAVYADDKDAIFVSHDVEFAERRSENTFGRHVHVGCPEPRAAEVMAKHLDKVLELALSRDAILIKVTQDEVKPYPRSWV